MNEKVDFVGKTIGNLRVGLIVVTLAIVTLSSAYGVRSARAELESISAKSSRKGQEEFPVPFRPLPKTITPCRACHGPEKDFEINWTRQEVLRVHTDIRLEHGGHRVWCLDCHHPIERNYLLPLSDGKLITFEHSYDLCGKCHGTKYRDWRHGIHGKRTGFWNGRKTYHLCTHCHNPHSPRYKPMAPMPPPKKPRKPGEAQAEY
jgi:hypothetical protein